MVSKWQKEGREKGWREDVNIPLKWGSFSSSTFSVTWKRELLCLRGGVLAVMGMVSLGPVVEGTPRMRLRVPALGGVASSEAAMPVLLKEAIAAPGGGGEPGEPV